VTGLIEQGGSRRGALMLICDIWHPDVLEFIHAKREAGKITNANISVGITDDFMAAVAADASWDLVFPDVTDPDYDAQWNGDLVEWRAAGKPVVVQQRLQARELWDAIIESAWTSAEPGVWFKDRANALSNSWYFAPLVCTNPCGEQPLPAWSVCNLGALHLARFVEQPESNGEAASVAWDELGTAVRYAVRFLDNVIDAGPYFFEENREQQLSERRVGLGTMGLAEMLIRLGHRYGSTECLEFLDQLYHFIAREAYLMSAELADEKGEFPRYDREKFLAGGFMAQMDADVRDAIGKQGIRNVTLLTQAPTGTTGTMVGTSTGIEPFFSWTYRRYSRLGVHEERVAIADEWLAAHPGAELPDQFVTAMELTPEQHVSVQGAIQRWVDSSISKTCNVPADYTIAQTRELYELMYRLGCKGGTMYRDQSRDEQVLEAMPADPTAAASGDTVRALPEKRHGMTMSKGTPAGTAHITMNDDERGQPFEVFIEIGRGGSDLTAMAEAIGRLASLLLRMVSRLTPLERIKHIVGQLKGIGGSRSAGFGEQRTRSLPDALAQVLEEHYLEPAADHTATAEATPAAKAHANGTGRIDLCPVCGQLSLVHEEGCANCRNCGYSEC
jgi:ribonucleoside-diphosphate reductase alpha chain